MRKPWRARGPGGGNTHENIMKTKINSLSRLDGGVGEKGREREKETWMSSRLALFLLLKPGQSIPLGPNLYLRIFLCC